MSGNPLAPVRRSRPTAFRFGFVAGLALSFVVGALALFGARALDPQGWPGVRNVEIVSHGDAIWRHGAARVVATGEEGSVTQQCQGVCDDLVIRETSGDNSYRVVVFDRRGARLACGDIGYVTSGLGLNRVVVGDPGRAIVRSSKVEKAADGSFRETVDPAEDGACAAPSSHQR